MAKKAYPSDKQDQFMLRLPDGMRDRIKSVADKNGRSMNAEIIALLERHFPTLPTLEETLEKVHRVSYQLEQLLEHSDEKMGSEAAWTARSLLHRLNELEQMIDSKTGSSK